MVKYTYINRSIENIGTFFVSICHCKLRIATYLCFVVLWMGGRANLIGSLKINTEGQDHVYFPLFKSKLLGQAV